ncbi:DUF4065 domain-containing protein (plasmid) [Citricoccus nitrophenolicus]
MSVITISAEDAQQKVRDALAATGLSWSQAQEIFSERDPSQLAAGWQHSHQLRTINRHLWLLGEPELGERAPAPGWLDVAPQVSSAVSVLDVAEAVLIQSTRLEITGKISTMKLQKLAFYAQAYSLAWLGEPMFDAEVHAWRTGPVVPKLQAHHAGLIMVGPGELGGDAGQLSPEQQIVVDCVVRPLNVLSGTFLGLRTREEAPWQDAYDATNEPGQRIISHEAMTTFYRQD